MTYHMCAFDSMWRYSRQREKWLDQRLTQNYAANFTLRDRLNSVFETIRRKHDFQPSTHEAAHPNITPLQNTNGSGERREDVIALLNNNSNLIKRMKEPVWRHQADHGIASMAPVYHQVVREQVETAILDEISLICSIMNLCIICFSLLCTLYNGSGNNNNRSDTLSLSYFHMRIQYRCWEPDSFHR